MNSARVWEGTMQPVRNLETLAGGMQTQMQDPLITVIQSQLHMIPSHAVYAQMATIAGVKLNGRHKTHIRAWDQLILRM